MKYNINFYIIYGKNGNGKSDDNMTITIDEKVKELMQIIESNNYHIYLVGGAVRDQIIGRDNKDYDLCTDMPLEKIKKVFPQFVIMRENDHRNTGNMRIGNVEIEISSFRGKDLKEDLLERDLTMNAVAADKDGNVIDYFNSVEDIKNKKISLVKQDGKGIDVDPLRILRALRFQGSLGFTLDENAKRIIKEKCHLLNSVAPERVYNEFLKILSFKNASEIIRENKEVFCTIIPELEKSIGFEQHNPYHFKDVFEHTLLVLDNTPNNIYIRLAALFHDLGKPYRFTQGEDGIGHFLGHATVSTDIFHRFAKKYKMDKKTEDIVSKLIYEHENTLSKKSVKMTKFIQKFGRDHLDLLFRLKEADIKGQNPKYLGRLEELKELEELYKKHASSGICMSVKDLKVNGSTLMNMGFFQKEIGVILKDVLDQVTCEQLVNSEESITSYVDKKYK